jgi:hypothetical protein
VLNTAASCCQREKFAPTIHPCCCAHTPCCMLLMQPPDNQWSQVRCETIPLECCHCSASPLAAPCTPPHPIAAPCSQVGSHDPPSL